MKREWTEEQLLRARIGALRAAVEYNKDLPMDESENVIGMAEEYLQWILK